MSEENHPNRSLTPLSSNLQHFYTGGLFLRYALLPPVAMIEEEIRTFWCLIDGIPDPFQISVDGHLNIDLLKEVIKQKAARHNLNASRLVIWKLIEPEPVEPEDTLEQRIGLRGELRIFAEKLTATQQISMVFPQNPLKNRVNIIIQLPSTTSQKLSSEHPPHKLWMLSREPQTTLFETRRVQRDNSCLSTEINLPLDCLVLKGGGWVRELQPDSHFTGVLIRDEYREALQAVMKWFLDDEATEDAMQVDDMQPASWGNPFLEVPIGRVTKRWGFVLLGSPGIDNGVFLIDLTGKPIATKFKSQFHPSTWCLIDSNQNLNTVPLFIQDLNLFIIQASSPRSHRFEWTDKATRSVLRYFMRVWTLSELLVGRVLQHEVHSEAQIEFFSSRYGTLARSVYTNASHPLKYDTALLEKLELVTYGKLDTLLKEASALNLSGPVSHQIVLLSPGASRNAFATSFPTRYIYEKLRDRLSAHKLEAVARLYDMYLRVLKAKGNAGFLLEDAVTDVFFRGGEWRLVGMMRSNRTGPIFTHWKDPKGPTSPRYLRLGYMGRQIAIDTNPNPDGAVYVPLPVIRFIPNSPLQLKDGCYYPSTRSQETFDGFIYESGSKTATVFQVTTTDTHSVKKGGIEWLKGLGVEKFRYIALSTPNTPLDLPFPNEWNTSTGPSITEKYLLTVESLPEK